LKYRHGDGIDNLLKSKDFRQSATKEKFEHSYYVNVCNIDGIKTTWLTEASDFIVKARPQMSLFMRVLGNGDSDGSLWPLPFV
jgi:hypothetical protein